MQVFDLESVKVRSRDTRASLRNSRAWAVLKEADRTLLELAEKGLSHRLIGQAVGVNAGTVSRRLALIRGRLQSPLSRLALDPASPLPAEHRQSALCHAVAGMSLRETARVRGTTLTNVTEQIRFAQGVARGFGTRRGGH